jgi:hypothetical protein
MRPVAWLARTSIPAVLALVVSACGGGGSGGDDGVASIDGNGERGDAAQSAASSEEALLDFVECLRDQGVDIADPQVDADGNLVLNPEAPAGVDAAEQSEADHARFRDDYEAAQEVCGEPPEDAVAGFDHGDEAEHDDNQLAYAQCMRDAGFDVPDPDPSDTGDREREEELDFDDPAVQAADQQCRQDVFGPDASSRGGGHGG